MRTTLLATLLAVWLAAPSFAAPAPPAAPNPAASAPAAPSSPVAGYDPIAAFAPLNMPEAANRYRSADGAPGPDYWQNRADYRIAARLEPKTKTLSGVETITYTNNSPGALDVLWLQLDQNIYRPDSRASGGGRPRTQFTDGYALDAVEIENGGQFAPAKYLVSDTRMQVTL